MGTYVLLGAIGAVWLLEFLFFAIDQRLWSYTFLIGTDVYLRPWTLITSTLAHSIYGYYETSGGIVREIDFSHILFNGLVLYFFGPNLERIWGIKKYLVWFFVAGAVSGLLQVLITDGLALGASGALMMVFGVLMILMPKAKVYLFFFLPVPFWAAGILFAALDILGAFNPDDGVGNFAHLAGLAIGIALGIQTKKDLQRRGLRLG